MWAWPGPSCCSCSFASQWLSWLHKGRLDQRAHRLRVARRVKVLHAHSLSSVVSAAGQQGGHEKGQEVLPTAPCSLTGELDGRDVACLERAWRRPAAALTQLPFCKLRGGCHRPAQKCLRRLWSSIRREGGRGASRWQPSAESAPSLLATTGPPSPASHPFTVPQNHGPAWRPYFPGRARATCLHAC